MSVGIRVDGSESSGLVASGRIGVGAGGVCGWTAPVALVVDIGAALAVYADLGERSILERVERGDLRLVSDAFHRVALKEFARDTILVAIRLLSWRCAASMVVAPCMISRTDSRPRSTSEPVAQTTPSARSWTIPSTSPALKAAI